MKKLLLLAFAMLSAAGMQAQSKTTGVVNLLAGMTAKLDLNNSTSTATLTFTGPSDRWYALQIGSFSTGGGMQDGQDVVYYNGTTLVDAVHNGVGVTPSTDAVNNWTVTSNTVAGTTRTIIATRAFNTGDSNDYTIVYNDASIDFAYSRSASASFSLAYHQNNRGYALNKAFSCIPPDAPSVSAQMFCAGATVANLEATGATGSTIKWYAASTGGSALAGTTALATGLYYVSQTVDACESARIAVQITINNVAAPTAPATQDFCSGANVSDLMATAANGGTLHWYVVPAGGAEMPGDEGLASTTYYVSQTVGDCTSPRTPVQVTVTAVPGPSTANETQEFCDGATVSELDVNTTEGTTLHWYAMPGNMPLEADAVMVNGVTYSLTQTIGDCESPAQMINVIIHPQPAMPGGATTQDFTTGETIADLEVSTAVGADVTWYIMNDMGDLVEVGTDTMLEDGGMYHVSQAIDGCESQMLAITANELLSNQEFGIKGFAAYPNPVKDILTISGKETIAGVTMYNLLGQKVLSQKVGAETTEINTATLPSGSYIIKAVTATGASASTRIIRQ